MADTDKQKDNEQLIDDAFGEVVSREEQRMREAFPDGYTPDIAQARAIIWLDGLCSIHAQGAKDCLEEGNAKAACSWAEDLGRLQSALLMLSNVRPIVNLGDDQKD